MRTFFRSLISAPLPVYGALLFTFLAALEWAMHVTRPWPQGVLTLLGCAALGAVYAHIFIVSRRQAKAFYYEVSEVDGALTVRDAPAPMSAQFRFRAVNMRQRAGFAMFVLMTVATTMATHGFLTEASFHQSYVDGVYGEMSQVKDALQKLMADTKRPELERKVREASEALVLASREADKQRIFYAQMIGRASLVAVLIFVMRFLVDLYRYQLRLATTYDAKADALSLAQSIGIDKAMAVANIDGVTFAQQPREADAPRLASDTKERKSVHSAPHEAAAE
ncbi:MAG: hypothetical protein JWN48_6020 [Myxococcaceae bacterium]|nr:hypothetical protein [Myxococcaceae bacterium]